MIDSGSYTVKAGFPMARMAQKEDLPDESCDEMVEIRSVIGRPRHQGLIYLQFLYHQIHVQTPIPLVSLSPSFFQSLLKKLEAEGDVRSLMISFLYTFRLNDVYWN